MKESEGLHISSLHPMLIKHPDSLMAPTGHGNKAVVVLGFL